MCILVCFLTYLFYYSILLLFPCHLVSQEIIIINQPVGVTCLTLFPVLERCEKTATFVSQFIQIKKHLPCLPIYGNGVLVSSISLIMRYLVTRFKSRRKQQYIYSRYFYIISIIKYVLMLI